MPGSKIIDNVILKEELIDLQSQVDIVSTNLSQQLNVLKLKSEEFNIIDNEANKLRESKDHSKNIVTLNISGVLFSTTISTLLTIKDSLFYHMVVNDKFSLLNSNSEIYFNRSPTHFQDILNYVRTGNFIQSKYSNEELDEIYEEAVYYELTSLYESMGDRLLQVRFNAFYSSTIAQVYDDETGNRIGWE